MDVDAVARSARVCRNGRGTKWRVARASGGRARRVAGGGVPPTRSGCGPRLSVSRSRSMHWRKERAGDRSPPDAARHAPRGYGANSVGRRNIPHDLKGRSGLDTMRPPPEALAGFRRDSALSYAQDRHPCVSFFGVAAEHAIEFPALASTSGPQGRSDIRRRCALVRNRIGYVGLSSPWPICADRHLAVSASKNTQRLLGHGAGRRRTGAAWPRRCAVRFTAHDGFGWVHEWMPLPPWGCTAHWSVSIGRLHVRCVGRTLCRPTASGRARR